MKHTTRQPGGWIQTFTGKQFFPLNPSTEQIDILDIAHALSLQCRFSGHTIRHYSVAEHSLAVAELVTPQHKLWALLHDAAEAYLVDLPTPIKLLMPDYMTAEARIMDCVCRAFGLPQQLPQAVIDADLTMLSTEKRDLMGTEPAAWQWLPPALTKQLQSAPVYPDVIEKRFLDAFEDYSAIQREMPKPTYSLAQEAVPA